MQFNSQNNGRPLRRGEYRVWRYGESAICRSLRRAIALVSVACRMDSDAQAVDHTGRRSA